MSNGEINQDAQEFYYDVAALVNVYIESSLEAKKIRFLIETVFIQKGLPEQVQETVHEIPRCPKPIDFTGVLTKLINNFDEIHKKRKLYVLAIINYVSLMTEVVMKMDTEDGAEKTLKNIISEITKADNKVFTNPLIKGVSSEEIMESVRILKDNYEYIIQMIQEVKGYVPTLYEEMKKIDDHETSEGVMMQ